jgi:hypothetical protein
MAKNKQNSKDDLSIFFEEAKTSAPKVSPAFKARILKDAHKTWGGDDVMQDTPRLDITFVCLKELLGFPSVLGFGVSLAVGFYIGFYSPDWTQFLASFFQINTLDEVDFTGLFFGMNEIF